MLSFLHAPHDDGETLNSCVSHLPCATTHQKRQSIGVGPLRKRQAHTRKCGAFVRKPPSCIRRFAAKMLLLQRSACGRPAALCTYERFPTPKNRFCEPSAGLHRVAAPPACTRRRSSLHHFAGVSRVCKTALRHHHTDTTTAASHNNDECTARARRLGEVTSCVLSACCVFHTHVCGAMQKFAHARKGVDSAAHSPNERRRRPICALCVRDDDVVLCAVCSRKPDRPHAQP